MQRIDLELGCMLGFRILSSEERGAFERKAGAGVLSCKIGGKDGVKDMSPRSTKMGANEGDKGTAPFSTRVGIKEGRTKPD